MTDNREFADKSEKPDRSKGSLGQKEAAREERADEELEHMGDDKASREDQSKPPKKGDN